MDLRGAKGARGPKGKKFWAPPKEKKNYWLYIFISRVMLPSFKNLDPLLVISLAQLATTQLKNLTK